MKGKDGTWLEIFEIFQNAADGDIGAIVILGIAGLFLMRFLFALLKFVFKQFPALFFGTIAGFVLAEEDGVIIDDVFANPERLPELLPYLLPALAVAFVIWNVILFILRAVFRSIFGKVRAAVEDQHSVSRSPEGHARAQGSNRHNVSRTSDKGRHRPHAENEVVTASETGAKRQRDKLLQAHDARKKRVHAYDLAHGGDRNEPMVIRRRKVGATVVRG